MKSSQIIVLAVALVAAIGAGILAKGFMDEPAPVPQPQLSETSEPAPPPVAVEEVLVMVEPIGIGETLILEQMRWQKWPAEVVDPSYVVKSKEPDAINKLVGTTVRLPLTVGEPIRKNRLVGFGKNYMSAVLPKGMRALAVRVSSESTGGGFVLPNDYVDLMGIKTEDGTVNTNIILENVRVLAIDQFFKQGPDGPQTSIGQTATLELSPDEVELVTVAQQTYDQISLVLRSVKDVGIRAPLPPLGEREDRQSKTVRLIKGGQASK
ncbi:Flp pilus assembly protein CpaB [Notoacmeibacter sp. MSK16QG-6]|uniref:Flp pilus assembly protein CpaB n=1 Tax=Notoacmeibacter sp. MSK16QG-6 TaxID=2957982 RepID=UPI0020A167A1|nr:Flp pilus assembly protein CpaB [Notoacmeibacter sp. MSK16QG-6]MCP1198768.1 Flp pilus assembly protein CpaB [Notoacmeibacter sp. MSK16QG-6]